MLLPLVANGPDGSATQSKKCRNKAVNSLKANGRQVGVESPVNESRKASENKTVMEM